jgi:hypothetical protein
MSDSLPERSAQPTHDHEALAAGARRITRAAPTISPIVDAVVAEATAGPMGGPAGRPAGTVVKPWTVRARDVVIEQRDAMAVAVAMRDDESRPARQRAVWARVVEALAQARRDAKASLGEARRRDPSAPLLHEAVAAEEKARVERGYDERAAGEVPGDVGVAGADLSTGPVARPPDATVRGG